MAGEDTPVRSDFEIDDNLLLHDTDTEDAASIGSENGSFPFGISPTPFEDEVLDISDTQPAYSFRKRTERKTAFTFLDQDNSGNFDPAEEKKVVGRSKRRVLKEHSKQHLAKLQREKSGKNRNATKEDSPNLKVRQQGNVEQQDTSLPPRKSSNLKTPTVEVQDRVGTLRNKIDPLRPEDYLTKEDFEHFEDLEDLRKQMNLKSRSPSPDVLEDTDGHRGVVTKMKTSFTHPIEFCIGYDTTGCNFCGLPTYGLFGNFEKEIYCIRWNSGMGFTQLSGGDAEATTTTMCHECTIERMQIAVCEEHEIHYENPPTLDFAETLNDLLAQEEPHMIKQQLSRWCSMCISPATHVCRARTVSMYKAEEAEGCGLKLCASCEIKLREAFNGDSSAMAAALDQESKTKEDDEDFYEKVRADVGFLCKKGILMKNMENEADDGEDGDAGIGSNLAE